MHGETTTAMKPAQRRTSSRRPLARGGVGNQLARSKLRALTGHVDIDLTTLVPQLDTVASDLVAHQRDTLTQRKDLAQKTKDFRKLDDSSKLNDIKALLKCVPLIEHSVHGRADLLQHTKASLTLFQTSPSPSRLLSSNSTPLYPKHPTHTPSSKHPSTRWSPLKRPYRSSHPRTSIYKRP